MIYMMNFSGQGAVGDGGPGGGHHAAAVRNQGPQGAPNHSSSSSPNHPPVNFCDIMSVFEKAVTEVKQGQDAFNSTSNWCPPERDITYFNRTLVSRTLVSFYSAIHQTLQVL